MSRTALPRPLDPFAGSRDGRYEDDAVVVVRRESLDATPGERWTTVTEHFTVGREGDRLMVEHALRQGSVDNDVAALLDDELFAPGWASGSDTFERLMTGIILSCHDDALTSWEAFYRNTLGRLAELVDGGPQAEPDSDVGAAAEGTLAGYAPVYRWAERLVYEAATRTLLDLGSCFGFFPLRMAGGSTASVELSVQAADISPGTCDLLSRVSSRLGTPVPVLVCDAGCVPLPDAAVDTVTLLHVLEHVDAAHGASIIAEAVRLARRRVVIAVPLETEPEAAFGHVRTVSLQDLTAWGAIHSGKAPWRSTVSEHHGGWLVLDRLLPPARRPR
jgi:hypothetical protein